MFFCGVDRPEPQLGGDLGSRWGRTGALDGALHQIEDLLLSGSEFGGVVHNALAG